MFGIGLDGYARFMPRIHPMRRLAFLAFQTGLSSWIWNNRGDLAKRAKSLIKGGKDDVLPDTTRPLGDRFVPPIAGSGPSPFESAKAEEALLSSPDVAAREQASNSHVSILTEAAVIGTDQQEKNIGTRQAKVKETDLKHEDSHHGG